MRVQAWLKLRDLPDRNFRFGYPQPVRDAPHTQWVSVRIATMPYQYFCLGRMTRNVPLVWRGLLAFLLVLWVLAPEIARAQAPQVRMRIVGGLANVNQYTKHEEPFWARELQRLSDGRFAGEIVPFDQAGLRGSDMLRLIQLGAVPFGTPLLSQAAIPDPELGAADLAGLNPDMASLRRQIAAFRPHIEQRLRERWGVEALAVYVYPAQVTFCRKAFNGLADLAGRRIRSPSPTTSDLIEALGAVPVQIAFAEVVSSMRAGTVDCAITGTMSGNTSGLHEVTTHVHAMAVSWGLAVFGANTAAWNALPIDLRTLLQRELPRLENAIWTDAERETGEGLACNSGAAECVNGRKGKMRIVKETSADAQRRRELFVATVLPRWVQRCGPRCAMVWNNTLRPGTGIVADSGRK